MGSNNLRKLQSLFVNAANANRSNPDENIQDEIKDKDKLMAEFVKGFQYGNRDISVDSTEKRYWVWGFNDKRVFIDLFKIVCEDVEFTAHPDSIQQKYYRFGSLMGFFLKFFDSYCSQSREEFKTWVYSPPEKVIKNLKFGKRIKGCKEILREVRFFGSPLGQQVIDKYIEELIKTLGVKYPTMREQEREFIIKIFSVFHS
ncbi:hypothetical protein HOC80_05280 [archaeon]|nr:hypothetical protein [archaeon]MBT4417484.1 hypothetical protein [archaeon]